MDGGAWWAAVHEVAKTRTQVNDFTFFTTLLKPGAWVLSSTLHLHNLCQSLGPIDFTSLSLSPAFHPSAPA